MCKYIYNKIFSPLGICLGTESYSSVILGFGGCCFHFCLWKKQMMKKKRCKKLAAALCRCPYTQSSPSRLFPGEMPQESFWRGPSLAPEYCNSPFHGGTSFPLMTSPGEEGEEADASLGNRQKATNHCLCVTEADTLLDNQHFSSANGSSP